MNALITKAFADELEKVSARIPLSFLGRSGRALVQSGAGRAALGALPGAAIGYYTAPEDQRVQRAILGGTIGAVGGFASPLATRAGRQATKDWGRRWAATQKHQFTGRGRMPISPKASPKEIAAIRGAEKAGLTSLPGLAKGLRHKPGQTLREAWRHAGGMGKALAIGDVALTARDVADPTTETGVGEKALGGVGTAGGYLLASRMGLVPAMLVGSLGSRALGTLGRGVDVLTGERGRKQKAKQQQQIQQARQMAARRQVVPSEIPAPPGRPSTRYIREQTLGAL